MIAIISAVAVIGAISQVAHAGPGNCPKAKTMAMGTTTEHGHHHGERLRPPTLSLGRR